MNTEHYSKYTRLIKDYIYNNYKLMLREPKGLLKYPFIVPGSVDYPDQLWDWDSFLTDVALRQMMEDMPNAFDLSSYEKGCVLNYLELTGDDGYMPVLVQPHETGFFGIDEHDANMHKPCIAQHIAFILQFDNDTSWFEQFFGRLERFIKAYQTDYRHPNGLYFWRTDLAIGVDNDPCTFYRPECSSASLYLNTFMYKELEAMEYICEKLGNKERAEYYKNEKIELAKIINDKLWDEKDGFYYSADLNLLPIVPDEILHSGAPRQYDYLIQRIGVWTGVMPMWAGIASPAQAKRIVEENYKDEKSFFAPYGIRSLSKYEKMYRIIPQGNPSCWSGPIWGIANYFTFKALLKYGFEEEAKDIAFKTVEMFGKDIEENGQMHEYYYPESGEGVHNEGFQSWNFLVLNMIAYLDGKRPISEF